MITQTIDVRSLDEAIGKLDQYQDISNRHLRTAMGKSVKTFERHSKMDAPVGVSGELRSKIGSTVMGFGSEIKGVVGAYTNYAAPVHEGSRPHWMPYRPLTITVLR